MEIPKEFAARFPDFLPVWGKNDRLSGQGEARRGVALYNATPRFCAPKSRKKVYMNRNPKEKPARLYLRVSPQEKKKIEDPAKNCGLSTAEYLRKRALGYVPKPAISDTFYIFKAL